MVFEIVDPYKRLRELHQIDQIPERDMTDEEKKELGLIAEESEKQEKKQEEKDNDNTGISE